MKHRHFFLLAFCVFAAGCSSQSSAPPLPSGPHALVDAQNKLFLDQKTYDPWLLVNTDPASQIPPYVPDGAQGSLFDPLGQASQVFSGGTYDNKGVIVSAAPPLSGSQPAPTQYKQTLDLQTGTLTTVSTTSAVRYKGLLDWPSFWKTSDIVVGGDPEAQQVIHAGLFYLCGSADPGSDHSIPPMGLSSSVYLGHIFWDAEIWMMPALLPQHPDLAKSIVDYRFNRLVAAEKLAKEHGFAGAEYPWESAATGLEEAPEEFSHERHITADVAYAAWKYYLWTGDKNYLSKECWPVMSATSDYWVSRVKLGADGFYHIANVIGPDENAGQVTDDAYTNAIVQYTLSAAGKAAAAIGKSANPKWAAVAAKLYIPYDKSQQLFLEYLAMNIPRSQAKQADTQMLIYPLNYKMSSQAASNTLDYYIKHTINVGPAMTSSINAIIAARLGRAQQSLDLYHDSYRPFMRGPWDAFSEKRTKSDVYFTTGIGGNLQVVLYGFCGLNLAYGSDVGDGTLVAKNGDTSLYVSPHLPPGWTDLVINGIKFRGSTYRLDVKSGNTVTILKS